jgi:HAD superfamily hydrolase (TIGR01509 family)
MNYQCIIFDCDGVLVDTESISNRVLIEMARELGLEVSNEHAERHFSGAYLRDVFAYFEAQTGQPLAPDFEANFRQQSYAAFSQELQPMDGIADLLQTLTVPFCVASSGPREKIRLNLTTVGLIHHFEGAIFSAYDIQRWKPDPGIFLHAAKTMGFAPQDCLVVEDTLPGITAARGGGFDVVGFSNGLVQKRTVFDQEGVPNIDKIRDLLALFR